jgi:hypothetical protein
VYKTEQTQPLPWHLLFLNTVQPPSGGSQKNEAQSVEKEYIVHLHLKKIRSHPAALLSGSVSRIFLLLVVVITYQIQQNGTTCSFEFRLKAITMIVKQKKILSFTIKILGTLSVEDVRVSCCLPRTIILKAIGPLFIRKLTPES